MVVCLFPGCQTIQELWGVDKMDWRIIYPVSTHTCTHTQTWHAHSPEDLLPLRCQVLKDVSPTVVETHAAVVTHTCCTVIHPAKTPIQHLHLELWFHYTMWSSAGPLHYTRTYYVSVCEEGGSALRVCARNTTHLEPIKSNGLYATHSQSISWNICGDELMLCVIWVCVNHNWFKVRNFPTFPPCGVSLLAQTEVEYLLPGLVFPHARTHVHARTHARAHTHAYSKSSALASLEHMREWAQSCRHVG